MNTNRYQIAKLRFGGGFYVGSSIRQNYDKSDTVFHSDTLSAALVSTYVELGGDDAEAFMRSFTISSAMPFWRDICFLPLQFDRYGLFVGNDENRKELKSVKWIDSVLWSKVASGQKLTIDKNMVSKCRNAIAARELSEVTLMVDSLEEHVTVKTDGFIASTPYVFDRVYMGDECGMYIICQIDGEEAESEFKRVLGVLGDNGLGARRSTGNGLFEVEYGTLDIDVPEVATYRQLLSVCIPEREELKAVDLESSCYKILSRGGYMGGSSNRAMRSLQKKNVSVFAEGSVLCCAELCGKVVDLRPDDQKCHPVWRDGRCICLPYNFMCAL